jgi:hypothetical protein
LQYFAISDLFFLCFVVSGIDRLERKNNRQSEQNHFLQFRLHFWVKADATNSFDSSYDQVASPTPPIGVNAYFAYPTEAVTYFQKLSTSFLPESNSIT